ncbi:hypothetical protein R3W88_010482 [Solanum pinnatisectum]|uniref:Uncharacterized protein n=1 Tax=Solanum pinnatisectum TaxID=50273 RepID=A0AAV9MEA5_9SOLN|nr:hypothetical protein R3W88_010482 [Solanum pinnatisectum]
MAYSNQNSFNKSKTHVNSTSIFSQARRKMSFRRKKLPVVQVEAGGKQHRQKVSPVKIFRRDGLKGKKLQYLSHGASDTFEQRRFVVDTTSFAIPMMGLSFPTFPNHRGSPQNVIPREEVTGSSAGGWREEAAAEILPGEDFPTGRIEGEEIRYDENKRIVLLVGNYVQISFTDYITKMAKSNQNSVNKSKSNDDSTSIFSQSRRKMSFRRKKLPVVQVEARRKKHQRKISPVKIFRRDGLKEQKLQYLSMKKLKECYWSAVNDILEGSDTFDQRIPLLLFL